MSTREVRRILNALLTYNVLLDYKVEPYRGQTCAVLLDSCVRIITLGTAKVLLSRLEHQYWWGR